MLMINPKQIFTVFVIVVSNDNIATRLVAFMTIGAQV